MNKLMERAYPEAKGLNKSKLRTDTGLSRDTLIKIFNLPPQPVQKRCLEDLFEGLNARVEESYRNRHQPNREETQASYEWRIKQELKKEGIPFREYYCTDVVDPQLLSSPYTKQDRPRHSSLQPSGIGSPDGSSQKQLVTLLQSLDYEAGQTTFIRVIKQRNPAKAFLVHVHDTRVHRWLVKRLEQEVPCYENAKRAEINVARLGGNFELLWVDLAGQLQLPNGTIESRIASLSELCQKKTVIIALSRFQWLDEGMQRQLIEEFWLPLVQRVCSENRQYGRSRLVLFLFEDGVVSGESRRYPFEVAFSDAVNKPEYPVRLESLQQISIDDVQYWFDLHGADFLAKLFGEEEADKRLKREKFSQWELYPWATLENICNVFRTEITEIEHYWKLTG